MNILQTLSCVSCLLKCRLIRPPVSPPCRPESRDSGSAVTSDLVKHANSSLSFTKDPSQELSDGQK